jgi:hypothetical protein
MPKGYRPYLPDQDLLLPPSLREWVAEEHLVYFVSDVVDQLVSDHLKTEIFGLWPDRGYR